MRLGGVPPLWYFIRGHIPLRCDKNVISLAVSQEEGREASP